MQVPSYTAPSQTVTPYEMRNRRKARAADLLDAIRQVDTVSDPEVQRQLMDWINSCYQDRGGGMPIGLFSTCYLGAPYVDHQMDLSANILQHFTLRDHVELPFSMARPLAQSGAYLYIEVYVDGQLLPVRPDGTSAG